VAKTQLGDSRWERKDVDSKITGSSLLIAFYQ